MGGGKTRWICEMALLLSARYPGNLGLVARQSGPALRLSTQEVFFDETLIPSRDPDSDWIKLGCKFNKSEGILRFEALDPPSKIWFSGLDQDNLERIKSLNLGFFAIDEATEIAEATFMMLCTRLRRKGVPRESRKGMITANPEAGWCKRRFVDQKLPNHLFVQAGYKDNPYLPEDYHHLFDYMPLQWREKYLHGNWGAVSGLVYKDFDWERHVIPSQDIPPEWRYFRALDHGQQNPCSCIGFAYGYPDKIQSEQLLGEERMKLMNPKFDSYPVIVAYRMYYSPGLVTDHRAEIDHLFRDIERPGSVYADPSIWKRDREKLLSDGKPIPFSIAQEYGEHPYPLRGLVRANNQVLAGVNRVSTLLRIGHLYFMDNASLYPLVGESVDRRLDGATDSVVGEIQSYAWRQPRKEDEDWPEEPMKRNDHACDALRYGVMTLPPLKAEDPKLIPYNSFMAARQRALADKRGKRGLTIRKGRVIGI